MRTLGLKERPVLKYFLLFALVYFVIAAVLLLSFSTGDESPASLFALTVDFPITVFYMFVDLVFGYYLYEVWNVSTFLLDFVFIAILGSAFWGGVGSIVGVVVTRRRALKSNE